jgi:hypothetical protein
MGRDLAQYTSGVTGDQEDVVITIAAPISTRSQHHRLGHAAPRGLPVTCRSSTATAGASWTMAANAGTNVCLRKVETKRYSINPRAQ